MAGMWVPVQHVRSLITNYAMSPHTHWTPQSPSTLTVEEILGYCRVRVTDLVVLIQPAHAWGHLVHNPNLGGELVLHQVGRQVPTHKPNTCSEQTDPQTDRPADRQADRQAN